MKQNFQMFAAYNQWANQVLYNAAMLLAERLAHGEGCEAQPDIAEDLWAQLTANGAVRLPDFTLPPPPVPSIIRTIGMPYSLAICSAISILPAMEASDAPPRTVKSSPRITAGRPFSVPRPNTIVAGRNSAISSSGP